MFCVSVKQMEKRQKKMMKRQENNFLSYRIKDKKKNIKNVVLSV